MITALTLSREPIQMTTDIFTHTQHQLREIASDVLRFAKEKGAADAVVEISEGHGLSVSVRKGQVETIEQNKDKGIGVTVFLGHKGSIRRGMRVRRTFRRSR